MVIWAAIEYPVFRGKVNNFFAAKGAAVYIIPAVTALIFYTYTAFTGEDILIVDILIFAAAVAIGQLVSYRILTSGKLPGYKNWVGLAMIIALGSSMILFTFNPPELPIFLDPNGFYGIPFGAR
jgi:hypothetical protein